MFPLSLTKPKLCLPYSLNKPKNHVSPITLTIMSPLYSYQTMSLLYKVLRFLTLLLSTKRVMILIELLQTCIYLVSKPVKSELSSS